MKISKLQCLRPRNVDAIIWGACAVWGCRPACRRLRFLNVVWEAMAQGQPQEFPFAFSCRPLFKTAWHPVIGALEMYTEPREKYIKKC